MESKTKSNGMPRVLISAVGSGCGKTIITSGLLNLLKAQNPDLHAFKCGPDYIDPMYHRTVLGIPSRNLDPFFCDEELLRAVFASGAGKINLIEGAMGLYDGLGVTSEYGTMEVAEKLMCPVILTVDCKGMGAGILAVISGFLDQDSRHLIKGVILNRISPGFFEKIKPEVERRFGIKVIGYLPVIKDLRIDSRHLGLKMPEETDAAEQIGRVSDIMRETFDTDALMDIACGAPAIKFPEGTHNQVSADLSGLTVGVAKDPAFSFYYEDNLEAIKLAGARIREISPVYDEGIPKDTDAVYMGGGYPEKYLRELEANVSFKRSLRAFVDAGRPLIAECGAFMYLQHDIEGYEMAGVFSGSAYNTGKLVRFGYVRGDYGEYHLKGHEFHYYDVTENGCEFHMTRISDGKEYGAVMRKNRCIAGFPHFYFYSDPMALNLFKI